MKTIKLLSCLAIAAMAIACAKEIQQEQIVQENRITEINASFADTKTVLGSDGTTVLWNPQDQINVFLNSSSVRFTSMNTKPDEWVIFQSDTALIFGGNETSGKSYLWGVYPYSTNNECDGESVTLAVPSSQTAVEGSFGRGAFPSVGRSKTTDIAFYNVCGGVCFSVSASDVRRVTFSGLNNEKLSGKVRVSFAENGKPVVCSVVSGEEDVILDAPEGEAFIPGELYYMSILPSALPNGFKMMFYTPSKHAKLVKSTAFEIKRSVFGSLKNADAGLVYEDGGLETKRVFTASLDSGTKTSMSETGVLSWDEWQKVFLSDTYSTDTPVISKQTEQTGALTTKKMNETIVLGGIPSEYFSLNTMISCTVPTVQDGSFNGACIAMAKTDLANTLNFSPSTAILKLILSEDVDSVRFTASDNVTIAGTCVVNMSGEPSLESPSALASSSIIAKPASRRSVFYFGVLPCYTKITIAIYKDGGVAQKSSSAAISFTKGKIIAINAFNSYFAVDLGLSVKWATCNIGATNPWDSGRYFAWGDVAGQTWDGSSWSGGGFSGYPSYELDENNNLKPEYDAAHVLLGGTWRMPTKAEQEELINNCTSTWTNINGVNGRLFASKREGYTDKSIFLPAAGYGDSSGLYVAGSYGLYWSGTFRYDSLALGLDFSSDGVGTSSSGRYYGFSVRPVSEY